MLVDLWHSFEGALGLELPSTQLRFSHMALRCVVVFFASIVMTRVGDRRVLGRNAAFDVMLTIILGSVISRAINGQAPFFPTLGAGFVLMLLHRLLAKAACHSHWVSLFAKGSDRVLVRDGKLDEAELARSCMTIDDLLENLRLQGNVGALSEVREARLERNGTVSVIKRGRG
jgi:uncharacterized membrane protein YcaP (DUF421 family)